MYYLVYGFFYLFSLLPFWLMYLLSDGISFLLYHIFRYRRALVKNNIAIAFPEKTENERTKIERDFYTRFTDNWIEFIKLFSISKKELNKRFTANYELLNELYNSGYNVQTHLGHFFNWEYANMAYGMNILLPFAVVYRPLSNKVMDRVLYKVRSRFNSLMISAYNFRNEFAPFVNKRFLLVLVADQREFPQKACWAPFFGKMTTFVQGPERTARRNNAVITMGNIKSVKRGYYVSEVVILTKDPRSLPEGEITKRMIAFIEDTIREQPANYLWSHNRWKYTFDPEIHKAL
jgi:KDO2-lipid IV(A) lauroyltransferase